MPTTYIPPEVYGPSFIEACAEAAYEACAAFQRNVMIDDPAMQYFKPVDLHPPSWKYTSEKFREHLRERVREYLADPEGHDGILALGSLFTEVIIAVKSAYDRMEVRPKK
jgi:hypothetical protein